MTAEPENLVLEHLRAIRGDIGKIQGDIPTIKAEMVSMRWLVSGVITMKDNDHDDIASLKARVDRIEQRLELVD